MKKYAAALLCAMFALLASVLQAQITIVRPPKITQTYVVSQSEGKLNYTVNNGVRKNYRVVEIDTVFVDVPPLKVYLFNPAWQITATGSKAYEAKPRQGNPNDFAQLIVKFNKERRKIRWMVGCGEEMLYQYEGDVLVATKKGMLSYIIRNGKREEYRHSPAVVYRQEIIECYVYPWSDWQDKEPHYVSLALLPEDKVTTSQNAQAEKAKALDDQDFAKLQKKLSASGWNLIRIDHNNSEVIYYYEK